MKLLHWFLLRNPVITKILQILFSQQDSVCLYNVGSNAFSTIEDEIMEDVIQKTFESENISFDRFSLQPIACGSIGRVYRLGKYCIKVQIPNIRKRIETNIYYIIPILRIIDFFTMYRYHLRKRCETFMSSIETQYDFLEEVRQNKIYSSELQRYRVENVYVPEIYFYNENCIVMEYLDAKCVASEITLSEKVSNSLLSLHISNMILFKYMHIDLHGGNILIDDKERLYVIDFGMMQKHIGYLRSINLLLFLRSIIKKDFQKTSKIALKSFFYSDKECTKDALGCTDILRELEYELCRVYHENFHKSTKEQLLKCQEIVDYVCSQRNNLWGDDTMSRVSTCLIHLVSTSEKSNFITEEVLKKYIVKIQKSHDTTF